uniref:Uncharacterized protein n=1 Tax=Dicentrarchus labrax TaxID=13489 RepID=A0A8C4HPR4_DICLA
MLPNSHLTTDFVCNQHTTAVSPPCCGWSQYKCLISYFLQVIVLSSHFPPCALCLTPVVYRQVSHFYVPPLLPRVKMYSFSLGMCIVSSE